MGHSMAERDGAVEPVRPGGELVRSAAAGPVSLPVMPSIFSRIIAGEIPGRIVWDDPVCVAMVDIRPLHPGHCLVIPRAEVDHWVDLDEATVAHLMAVAHHLGRAQRVAFPCRRIGLLVAGYEVPHTHVHVLPTDTMADFDFARADATVPAEELDRVADLLRRTLTGQGHAAYVPATPWNPETSEKAAST
jgi:histidine triad (HIT) family protein